MNTREALQISALEAIASDCMVKADAIWGVDYQNLHPHARTSIRVARIHLQDAIAAIDHVMNGEVGA
jgi:hypothetical protein